MVRVQEVFPLHPLPRGERGCGQRPRCWQDPWGSRSRGQCAVGTHFKGFGVLAYKAQSQLCVALLGCLVGTSQKTENKSTLSHWHGHRSRKRSFSRSHRENAGRASAGLVRPVLENRSNRAAETAEFREQPKRRFQRQTPHAKPRRCWIEHSLACFKFRFLNRPLVIGGRMSPVSLKLPHAPCAPLSLDNLQVLVQSLPVALS